MIGDDGAGAGAAVAGIHNGGGDDVNCKWNDAKSVVMELETPWHNKCMFVAKLQYDYENQVNSKNR